MSFIEVVDQVIALLRNRERISYRVLKREFTLDDEQVEDLKEELIEVQELAVDKDGKMLVWKGSQTSEETASQITDAPNGEPGIDKSRLTSDTRPPLPGLRLVH